MDPLPALLQPDMKLTIVFDDASLSLPKMRRPDNRQRIIEAVLDLAAAAGVDDIHIIAALGLHRRMHEYELRHVLGDRIYDAFHPRGMLYQHDAEDHDNLAVIGTTDEGEVVEINKRAADSDLIVYANVNQVAMDGGWKSITTGLASYRCLSLHHNPESLQNTRSLMGHREHSALHKSIWRMGKVLRDHGPKIFQIEIDDQHRGLPLTVRLPAQARVGVVRPRTGRRTWRPPSRSTACRTAPSARSSTRSRRPTPPPACRPGSRPSVHEITLQHVYQQHLVEVEGQTDILTMGIPFICPYNPEGIMNPILVMCMGLGYLFNMYRGKPLVREGGVVIMTHPTYREFNPVHHPSYIDFFDEVLADTTDPAVMSTKWEQQVRRGRVVPPPLPHRQRLPRRAPVLRLVLGSPRPAVGRAR